MPKNNGRVRKTWRKMRAAYNESWWAKYDALPNEEVKVRILMGEDETTLPYDFRVTPRPN